LLSPSVQAAASASNTIVCSTITDNVDVNFEVCATFAETTPSPADVNGTIEYIGGWSYDYTIYKGLAEGATATDAALAGIEVLVTRDDNVTCNVNVTVDGVTNKCKFCSFCGDDNYSTDCTNAAEYGRSVDCETVANGTVFFPFAQDALGLNNTAAPAGGSAPAPSGGTSPTPAAPTSNGVSKNGSLLLALVSGASLLLALY
jgi:hypothetical protein